MSISLSRLDLLRWNLYHLSRLPAHHHLPLHHPPFHLLLSTLLLRSVYHPLLVLMAALLLYYQSLPHPLHRPHPHWSLREHTQL